MSSLPQRTAAGSAGRGQGEGRARAGPPPPRKLRTHELVQVLQNRPRGGGVNDILLLKGPSLYLQGFPPNTKLTLPAAREKTSLNARDW